MRAQCCYLLFPKTAHLMLVSVLANLAGSAIAETRDLILVAGQSNAVGFDAYASELVPEDRDKRVMFWWRTGDPPPDPFDVTSGNQWTHLQSQSKGKPMTKADDATSIPPRQYGNFKSEQGGFGPEIGLSRHLQSTEAKPLAIVKVAFSGTSVKGDWNPSDSGVGGACYRALIRETLAAIEAANKQGTSLRPRALVWVHGESDATKELAPEYDQNLGRMLAQLRSDLSAPELIAMLGVNTRFGNGKNSYMPIVIAAQKKLALHDARCIYVNTMGAETLPPSHTHFTAKGTLEIGRRFAVALLQLEAGRKLP